MLRLTYLNDPNSLDPRFGYEIPANHTIKMLFEGLMRYTAEGEIVPALAKSVDVSEDGRTYTFVLREALWSNGEAVLARHFEEAWRSVVNPALPTQGAADFYPLLNAEAIVKGEKPIEELGVRSQGDRTLVVTLEHPAPYFLQLTTTSVFMPIYEDDPEVYNGPFLLKKWCLNDKIVMTRNSHYWNADTVTLAGIEISIIDDVQTQLALFEKNQSDWFGKPFTKLPLDAVESLRKREKITLFPERAVYWYFFNTERFPYNNVHIRRALSYGVTRREITEHVLKEDEVAATSVNMGLSFFQDGDLTKAKEELALGLKECSLEQLPPVRISYCNIETNQRIATAVADQLSRDLGIEVKLDPQEWTSFYANLSEGQFDMGGLSWHARIEDPIYNLQLFQHRDDRLNMSFWEHPHFQQLLSAAKYESDEAKRAAILLDAEALFLEEMPVMPIYFLSMSYAKQPRLDNVYLSELNQIDFASARLSER